MNKSSRTTLAIVMFLLLVVRECMCECMLKPQPILLCNLKKKIIYVGMMYRIRKPLYSKEFHFPSYAVVQCNFTIEIKGWINLFVSLLFLKDV